MSYVSYQWTVCELDGDKECVDVSNWDSFNDAIAFVARCGDCDDGVSSHSIELVRDDDSGRSWAPYERDLGLSEQFCDAYGNFVARVPKRLLQEVNAAALRDGHKTPHNTHNPQEPR